MVKQTEINEKFLDTIQWLKIERRISQETIVKETKLGQNAISKIKSGANAGEQTVMKLCDAYHLNPDFFFNNSPYRTLKEKADAELEQQLFKAQALLIPPSNAASDNMDELYAQRIRLVDDLRQSLREELAEVRAIKEDMHQAIYDFRDATYRLTQAINRILPSSTIPMAAESED